MKENRKAYASLCSAMLIFGTIAIFRRNIPFSSGLLAFSRGLLGGVFLLIFVAVKHHRMEKVEKKQLALLILSGAIIGVDWILLFEAYNCTTVAVATMCFYMQPTIVILLSPVLFRERLSVKKGLCALAGILGMVFVSGVAEGCVQAGCALIGGETAEHPGMMAADDYDLAGFTVGVVDKPKVIDSGRMAEGDVVLALPSSGFHSNGYSLVRKVFDVENADLGRYDDELGETLGEALLRPTVIYVKPVLRCIEAADVKGVSHITGGGFYENVPRCIPDGLCAKIDKAAVKTPAIFRLLQKKGGIDEHDMFNTFNMGVGMAVIVSPETADAALSALKAEGIDAYVCGEIVAGEEKVALC